MSDNDEPIIYNIEDYRGIEPSDQYTVLDDVVEIYLDELIAVIIEAVREALWKMNCSDT